MGSRTEASATRRIAVVAVVAAGVALAGPAQADTIRVTSSADSIPNGCRNDGCTLREAVIAANSRSGRDTVLLRSGHTYRLARAGPDEEQAQTGDLDLLGRTTVGTTESERATIDANLLDRAVDAIAAAKLSNLVIKNAEAPGPTEEEEQGGAVRSSGGGVVLRRARILRAQHPASGDFHAAVEDVGDGSVVLVRSRVVKSEFRGILDSGAGSVRLERSTVAGSEDEGVAETGSGGVTLVRSAVVNGVSRGGILTVDAGTSRIIRSRIIANLTGGFTAGGLEIGDLSSAVIDRSTIAGNVGALGGVWFPSTGKLTIRRSTISGNEAGFGGGGLALGGEVRIVNSTIANNRAHDGGGGILFFSTATATLNAVTVARNIANTDTDGGELGGGIYVDNGGSVQVDNTLLALNRLISENGTPSDCDDGGTTGIDSGGHNLRSDASGQCAFEGSGDLFRSNPRIGQLAENGGPTKTIALGRRSPAINRAGGDAPSTDQRGVGRQNPDIGAFERR
jgi:CSLREA domain-containing protein